MAHGFNFGIPNQNIKREDIFAKFELLYAQRSTHQAVSNEADQVLRARLSDLAHAYCGIPNDVADFHMQRDVLLVIQGLRRNAAIHICKLDKGTGVVIMNKIDYIDKMMDILKDETKFKHVGGVTEHDRMPQVEGQVVKRLLQLLKRGELSKEV